jgi:hypothetical protein
LNNALAERFAGKILEKNLSLVEEIPNQVPADQWKESIHVAHP